MDNFSYNRETTFFRFHPLSVVDDIINSTNENVNDGLERFEAALRTTKGLTAKQRQEIKQGMARFTNAIHERIDRNFDKFELYLLRNILYIPKDVNIEEVRPIKKRKVDNASPEESEFDDEMEQEILQLEKEIKEEETQSLRKRLAFINHQTQALGEFTKTLQIEEYQNTTGQTFKEALESSIIQANELFQAVQELKSH